MSKRYSATNMIFRYFANMVKEIRAYVYGTYWIYPDRGKQLVFTAGHVLKEIHFPKYTPPFGKDARKWIHNMGGLDISVYGMNINKPPKFRDVEIGMKLTVLGYPGASSYMESRAGYVYYRRSENKGQWIGIITNPKEPVISGMSGGMVLGHFPDGKFPVGVLITSNSPTDVDRDGIEDFGFDFVSIQEAITEERKKRGL